FLAVLAPWELQQSSNDRDWEPDIAVLPRATINGDTVTVHNIRNCAYLSETNYTVRHYDRTFLLPQLKTLDLYLVNWGVPQISHTMLSFGFGINDYVFISIETRKRRGQEYSAVKGFFRNYELIYVVADERDVVRLRTNFRTGENVYLYRTRPASTEVLHDVFLDYMRTINRLDTQPEWYNALTANCMVEAFRHLRPYGPEAHWHWTVIANGYFDRTLYDLGRIATNLPFAEMKAACLINARGKAAGDSPAFSMLIREGVPGM
ncbi:DUF4105 domain-containing protein, partial [bacterium]|nr:DUF4105 domain-containing protein [bacterium]